MLCFQKSIASMKIRLYLCQQQKKSALQQNIFCFIKLFPVKTIFPMSNTDSTYSHLMTVCLGTFCTVFTIMYLY